ncbi:hypothetical protein ASE51_04665 [Bacillus sp. Root147]|jgi:hypothetical protein|nr:hypothetical protein ASE51_04665 [Bacillus sp. Root147]
MKRLFYTVSTFCFVWLAFAAIHVSALSIEKLPMKKSSEQWSVELTKASMTGDNQLKWKNNVYHTYGLTVENIGKDVERVQVQAFRHEGKNKAKYSLFSPIERSNLSKSGQRFRYANFAVPGKAAGLDIMINWTDEQGNHQEHFEFK